VTVFVECNNDEALVRSLVIRNQRIVHVAGKVHVLRKLAECEVAALGIIDDDTGKQHSGYPKEMVKYCACENGFKLTLMRHSGVAGKSVVRIGPWLEQWLIDRAHDCRLSLDRYGLPTKASALHKTPHLDLNPEFIRFLSELASADDGMKLLGKWLNG
jgi:hypothetical protein